MQQHRSLIASLLSPSATLSSTTQPAPDLTPDLTHSLSPRLRGPPFTNAAHSAGQKSADSPITSRYVSHADSSCAPDADGGSSPVPTGLCSPQRPGDALHSDMELVPVVQAGHRVDDVVDRVNSATLIGAPDAAEGCEAMEIAGQEGLEERTSFRVPDIEVGEMALEGDLRGGVLDSVWASPVETPEAVVLSTIAAAVRLVDRYPNACGDLFHCIGRLICPEGRSFVISMCREGGAEFGNSVV